MEKSIAHPHVYTLVAVCIKVFDRPANNQNVKCVLSESPVCAKLCKSYVLSNILCKSVQAIEHLYSKLWNRGFYNVFRFSLQSNFSFDPIWTWSGLV